LVGANSPHFVHAKKLSILLRRGRGHGAILNSNAISSIAQLTLCFAFPLVALPRDVLSLGLYPLVLVYQPALTNNQPPIRPQNFKSDACQTTKFNIVAFFPDTVLDREVGPLGWEFSPLATAT
jgi:hypothetical protein